MKASWATLRTELQRWRDAGLRATFWWRDDDAEDDSLQLNRLLQSAAALETPLALAVIPHGAGAGLVARLRASPDVDVLQHGYAHVNHAPPTEKKAELGAHREGERVMAELLAGRERLAALFDTYRPVLVPPWNRIDRRLLPLVADHGFKGMSTFGPRAAAVDARGVRHVNTHADPIAWQDEKRFCGEAAALAQVLRHLSSRRTGAADGKEPTGLLTHHLVQDEACWAFCERLISETRAFDNVSWVAARELFAP